MFNLRAHVPLSVRDVVVGSTDGGPVVRLEGGKK